MYQVEKSASGFSAKKLFSLTSAQFNSEVHTPILYQNHLFAVSKPKMGQFTCLDLNGKIVWQSPVTSGSSGDRKTFDLGGFLLADGMFYALDGITGILRLIDANTKEYKELASAQILEGPDVWGPPALSNGRLLIRSMTRMVCLQVGK
jgi:outer membrane protein assembly factor BamB